jgi:hypothetical protein
MKTKRRQLANRHCEAMRETGTGNTCECTVRSVPAHGGTEGCAREERLATTGIV